MVTHCIDNLNPGLCFDSFIPIFLIRSLDLEWKHIV